MAWCSGARPAPALARPVLVALGLRPDGKKEVIDFRLASAESAAQWAQFLGDLIRRGLTGARLEMLCVDGGAGLLAALPTAFPNVLAKVRPGPTRRPSRPTCTGSRTPRSCRPPGPPLRRPLGTGLPQGGRLPARRFGRSLLTCFRYPTLEERKTVRTTNAIERRFREARRRTRPMGTFQDRTSMERILFAVFLNENRNQGLATPFALTQTF
jgi:putative transposase